MSPVTYGVGKGSGNLLLTQSTSSPVLASKQTQAQTTVPKDTPVQGIILKFHNWAGEEEETSIKNHLKKFGLKSVEELKQLNMWIFSWSKPDKIIKAEMACHSLSDFSSIELCGPDHSVTIDDYETGDLRSCDIVSVSFGLQSGKLSDYWAQRMIGSDLIKEELEQMDPVGKKELVRVFDARTRDHYAKVSNLISDDGDHSILPDIGNKMKVSITPYTSSILREANSMLQNAENVCASDSEEDEDTEPPQPPQPSQPSQPPQPPQPSQPPQPQEQQAEPETFTHGGIEYIRLHGWANNRNYKVSSVISFLGRNNVQIEQVDNPYIDQLRAAGESWSPTIHAIPNTQSNREKLEEYVQARGTITYSRNLTLFWKTATDWSAAWESASGGGQSPPTGYDLEADYEVDKSKSQLYSMEYSYIFRRPVLDMRGATSISTDLFNWLPPIVLAPGNKLKIWGTWEVGNGPLTINGVSVTLTEVAGTISDVPSTGKRHGRFEATLSAADYNTILTGGGTSNQNSSPRTPSSKNSQNTPPPPQPPPQPLQSLQPPLQPSSSSNQRSSQRKPSSDSTSNTKSDQSVSGSSQKSPQPVAIPPLPETVTYNGVSYIVLRAWANSRGLSLADVINFLNKEGVSILQVNNPQAAALRAAGKSWSPTVHAILNSESNRAKLERFTQGGQ